MLTIFKSVDVSLLLSVHKYLGNERFETCRIYIGFCWLLRLGLNVPLLRDEILGDLRLLLNVTLLTHSSRSVNVGVLGVVKALWILVRIKVSSLHSYNKFLS